MWKVPACADGEQCGQTRKPATRSHALLEDLIPGSVEAKKNLGPHQGLRAGLSDNKHSDKSLIAHSPTGGVLRVR